MEKIDWVFITMKAGGIGIASGILFKLTSKVWNNPSFGGVKMGIYMGILFWLWEITLKILNLSQISYGKRGEIYLHIVTGIGVIGIAWGVVALVSMTILRKISKKERSK
jgi:hypothetical protein